MTRVTGIVKITDANGNVKVYKNQVQSQFIQSIIQYASLGGTISNYAYSIQLLDANGNIVAVYTGSLSYKQVSTSLNAVFSFIITNITQSVSQLQLYLTSSLGTFLIAVVNNVSLPLNTTLQIEWSIAFSTSINDYFTPYLVFAFLSPPSSTTPFTNAPAPNTQNAINIITNSGYLTSPPVYYVTYSGQTIKVTPSITSNSITIVYNLSNFTSATSLTNISLYATGQSGNVNLVPSVQQLSVQVGQAVTIYYEATWST